jgi:hypothetical protein
VPVHAGSVPALKNLKTRTTARELATDVKASTNTYFDLPSTPPAIFNAPPARLRATSNVSVLLALSKALA